MDSITEDKLESETGDDNVKKESESGDETVKMESEAGDDIVEKECVFFTDYQSDLFGTPHPSPIQEGTALSWIDPPHVDFKFKIPEHLYKPIDGKPALLSGPQLQAIKYACLAMSKQLPSTTTQQGFLLGDGTGMGKSRTIAGIILELALRKECTKAVWISANEVLSASVLAEIKHIIPGVTFETLKEAMGKGFFKSWNMIVYSTYSQLAKKKHFDILYGWMEHEEYDGLIIFDEAHLAKNAKSKQGNRVIWLQRKYPKARILYSTATSAYEPSHLLYMERLPLWGPGCLFASPNDFVGDMIDKPATAMELVSMKLKESGVFLSRQLSFKGLGYHPVDISVCEQEKHVYDRAAVLSQLMQRYLVEYVHEKGAAAHWYGSCLRFFISMIISSKIKAVAEITRKELDLKHSVVIGLQHTGESPFRNFSQEKRLGYPFSAAEYTLREMLQIIGIEVENPLIYLRNGEIRVIDFKRIGKKRTLPLESETVSQTLTSTSAAVVSSPQPSTSSSGSNDSDDSSSSDTESLSSDRPRKRQRTGLIEEFTPFMVGHGFDYKARDLKWSDFEYWETDENSTLSDQDEDNETDDEIDDETDDETDDEGSEKVGSKSDDNVSSNGDVSENLNKEQSGKDLSEESESDDEDDETSEGNPFLDSEALEEEEDEDNELKLRMKQTILRLFHELVPFLPINPLDELRDRLNDHKIVELTSRKKTYDRITKLPKKWVQTSKPTSHSSKLAAVNKFMNGESRVAIISDTSSVGISLHADSRRTNKQKRSHITIELPWAADKCTQQMGRTHRSGQEYTPDYFFVKSWIPAEIRSFAIVAKRLAQLGAITNAQSKGNILLQNMANMDLCNPKGMSMILEAHSRLEGKFVGMPNSSKRGINTQQFVNKFFNRLLMQVTDVQMEFFIHLKSVMKEKPAKWSRNHGIGEYPANSLGWIISPAKKENFQILARNDYTTNLVLHEFHIDRTQQWPEFVTPRYVYYRSWVKGIEDVAILVKSIQTPANFTKFVLRVPYRKDNVYNTKGTPLHMKEVISMEVAKTLWQQRLTAMGKQVGCIHKTTNNECNRDVCYERWGKMSFYVLTGDILCVWDELISVLENIVIVKTKFHVDQAEKYVVGVLVKPEKVNSVRNMLDRKSPENADSEEDESESSESESSSDGEDSSEEDNV